jgi:hypothetical protein
MRKYQEWLIDDAGNKRTSVVVEVRVANSTPGAGAKATIFSGDGGPVKANPFSLDVDGSFSFFANDGRYDVVLNPGTVDQKIIANLEIVDTLELSEVAVRVIDGETPVTLPAESERTGSVDTVLAFDKDTGAAKVLSVGSFPPGPQGPPGTNNTVGSLEELAALDTDLVSAIAAGATFIWKTGDYSGLVDGVDYVASDSVAATVGAWVRIGQEDLRKLGAFSGSTIADNQTPKQAMQALETAVETKAAAAALGVAADAEDLGAMSPALIPDNATAKEAIEAIGTGLAADDGGTHVKVKQAGTGAVAETVTAAQQRMVFAQQFGTAQQALTELVARGGDTLTVDRGTAGPIDIATRTINVRGKGIGPSIVSPATADGVAIRYSSTEGSWRPVVVSDLQVTGTGTLQGQGFRAGPNSYTANAEYVGRAIIERTRFSNLDKSIVRPFGNIGMWINECDFTSANYHLHFVANDGTNGDVMHAGNFGVTNCHMIGAELASVYIEGDVQGTGQATFINCIPEYNPGYAFYFNGFATVGGPGINVFASWNEGNYTAASVTVAGETAAPVFCRALRSEAIYFHDTQLGPFRLTKSSVVSNQCEMNILTAIETDADSTIIHYNARCFSGTAKGLTMSIGGVAQQPAALNAGSFAMPVPSTMRANMPNLVRGFSGQTAIAFTGTTLRNSSDVNNDPALPAPFNRTQELTINNGETLLPSATFTIPAGKWLVWQYIARIKSGPAITVNITGNSGIGGAFTIEGSAWRCYTAIIKNAGTAIANESFYHYHGGATTVLGIGGIALVSFDTAQEALAYANSGAFIYDNSVTVASAATIILPTGFDFIPVTGSTNITSISASAADKGRIVTLAFDGTLTVVNGSNLKIGSDFAATADDTLTLGCDGTNWFQIGRSPN